MRAIEHNLALRDLGRFLREGLWQGLGNGTRVLADLTFALDYARAGLDPRAFHLTSLACHLAVLLALLLLGRRLLALSGWPAPEWPALAAAALWGLHPLNSQAVAYVVQRAELLASLAYALAVLLVLEAAWRGRTRAGLACYAGALLAAFLAFEAKPIAVSLPAAVLLALVAAGLPPGGEGGARRVWLVRAGLVLPFAAAALRYGAATVGATTGHTDIGFDIPALQGASYPATQLRVVLAYLRQLAWPDGLSLDHDLEPSRSFLEPAALTAGAGLLLLVAGVAWLAWWSSRPGRDERLARASRLAAFGVAWYLTLLSPTSSLVPLADLMVDHRPYLASFGVVLAAVVLADALRVRLLGLGRRSGFIGAAAATALAVALAGALHERCRAWVDPAATWQDVVEKAPGRWRGWQNLAQVAWLQGDQARAIQLLGQALTLAHQPAERLDTLRNLGACLVNQGAHDRAIEVLLQAEQLGLADDGLEASLAMALAAVGRNQEAEVRARRAIQLAPSTPDGYAVLGLINGQRGDHREALRLFLQASALDPDAPALLQQVATAEELLGRRDEACATWSRVGLLRGGASRAAAERGRLGCLR